MDTRHCKRCNHIKCLGQFAPSFLKVGRNVVNRERRNKKCGTTE